ncbi:MAG: sigma factor-like helix-turn-helix DNA-binding protein [Eubacteriales bacterium]|nr:sigma factor-like helix-turn-helix DNA-binding protein [Eubacteriales bacterium]
MTAEEYLLKGREIQKQAEQLRKLVEHLHKQKSKAYLPYLKRYQKTTQLQSVWERRANQIIDSLEDPNERLALSLSYIQCMPKEDIAQVMGYCRRQVNRIVRRALQNVEKHL